MSIISAVLMVIGLAGFFRIIEYKVDERKDTIEYQCRYERRHNIGCYKNNVCYHWNGYWWYPTKEWFYQCEHTETKK